MKNAITNSIRNVIYIKEPAGVDFFIKSKPLTDKDRLEMNAFIKASKAKNKRER